MVLSVQKIGEISELIPGEINCKLISSWHICEIVIILFQINKGNERHSRVLQP